MYEIARYTRAQHDGDRALPRVPRRAAPDCPTGSSSPRRCRSTARASTSAPSTAASRRGRGPRSSCSRATWELALPESAARRSQPVGTREDKPLIPTSIYAITKRDHEEMCLVTGARVRDPDRRAALLQRLRARPGALEPVHRCRGDLRLAPAQRRGRRSSSRTAQQSRDFIHVSRHRRRASCSRSSPTTPSATRSTSAPGGRRPSREVADVLSAEPRARHRAGAATSSTAPATSATASPTSTTAERAARLRGRRRRSRTA